MDATQTKMMHILVDLKKFQLHGSVKPIVANESLAKNNDIGVAKYEFCKYTQSIYSK
jgi:hypothetical protein